MIESAQLGMHGSINACADFFFRHGSLCALKCQAVVVFALQLRVCLQESTSVYKTRLSAARKQNGNPVVTCLVATAMWRAFLP